MCIDKKSNDIENKCAEIDTESILLFFILQKIEHMFK